MMKRSGFKAATGSLAGTLRIMAILLLFLSISRVVLVLWYWERVGPTGGVQFILLQGFRFDLVLMGMFLGPALLAAPWVTGKRISAGVLRFYLVLATFFIIWVELGTIPYIDQYDARPNFTYVEYLKYPREVWSMLLSSYGPLMVSVALVALAFCLHTWRVSGHLAKGSNRRSVAGALLLTPLVAVAVFAMIRSTLDHQPVNPSTVAFSTDSMVNQLALNSPYTLVYAIYEQNRDSRRGWGNYGHMPKEKVMQVVVDAAGLTGKVDPESAIPTLHQQTATRRLDRPMNLVIVLQESLGAEFVGSLGGKDLTPNLDSLADEGIWFERLYATGTRSVRGIEAIISGFPPTIKRSVVKLNETQSGFFTLASLLAGQAYETSFIYGGSAHFDNMRRFFLNNGFQRVIDQDDFENPELMATWGVSDEDLFNKAHDYFSQRGDNPFFSLVFTSSNHKPFEIPPGRVQQRTGEDAARDMAVNYADYAMGRFLAQARASAYYENTLFLVVSDHNSRVKGVDQIPVERFHIPGVIFGPGIEPRRITGISSQLDLLPTLLSLMGIDSRHPAIGFDLTRAGHFNGAGRAQMQFHNLQGWLVEGRLVVLQPGLPPKHFFHQPGKALKPDPDGDEELERNALAHALWAPLMIRNKAYRQ
jgi:phosphoglycerol transferase MdoB-like AlkP superfamily enzyme